MRICLQCDRSTISKNLLASMACLTTASTMSKSVLVLLFACGRWGPTWDGCVCEVELAERVNARKKAPGMVRQSCIAQLEMLHNTSCRIDLVGNLAEKVELARTRTQILHHQALPPTHVSGSSRQQ
jgi:hypothetical protein